MKPKKRKKAVLPDSEKIVGKGVRENDLNQKRLRQLKTQKKKKSNGKKKL